MSGFQHTYGPTCRLRRKRAPAPKDSSAPGPGADTEEPPPPPLNVHYFYNSSLPIDEPLSPIPPPTNNSASFSKIPARPFSALDNAALEEAWAGVFGFEEGGEGAETRSKQPNDVARRATEHRRRSKGKGSRAFEGQVPGLGGAPVEQNANQRVPGGTSSQSAPRAKGENQRPAAEHRASSPKTIHRARAEERPASAAGSSEAGGKGSISPYGASPLQKDTTGTPFLRAPSRKARLISPARPLGLGESVDGGHPPDRRPSSLAEAQSLDEESTGSRPSTSEAADGLDAGGDRDEAGQAPGAEIPVGLSRLHLVTLPQLQMEPIYWSPMQDVTPVTRGTWFYKDSMFPVEADLANQLEIGYIDLRAWTNTWNDELTSAITVGAEGEEKVTHRIWPEEDPKKADSMGRTGPAAPLESGEPGASMLPGEEEVSDNLVDPATRARQGTLPENTPAVRKRFPNSHVIYANAKEAFILQPSLIPSAYYGRRPVAKIRKGARVGVAVVRGFDWKIWNWLHPPQETATAVRADEIAHMSKSGSATADRRKVCRACLALEQTQKVTDLVLVIHGIGQQLSKRIESYAFTHAINSFRRQIHVELGKYDVQNHLRKDVGGIMALPINWRSTLSFEDGGVPRMDDEEGNTDPLANHFGLKDITPETIPAVRNLISDVMLDIPYYLSHHKPKMVQAVIREANRVYRLWCLNNPDFDKHGRVHVVAHSLGSAMALDVLSKQPTRVSSEEVDPTSRLINDRCFNFDTTNLFLCGSPAGFFLLLNRATLVPRRGRNKPGADGDDAEEGVAGQAGTYGCLAVDNLYNVMSVNDPVAYRLNAAVDTRYASSLKPAVIPSAATGFFSSLGAAFRFSNTPLPPPSTGPITTTISPTGPVSTTAAPKQPTDPTAQTINRLPATVELETHNFTHEELAEKRMHLLNDNGQLDFFLGPGSLSSSGTGAAGGGWIPLAEQMQYLNMLGAHSGYWASRDFVRFLVVEVGRRRGREGTVPAVRAVKKRALRR